MRPSDSRAEARFRADLGAWLDDNRPGSERASDPPRSSGHVPEWAARWQGALLAAGWLVPRWPPELGGRDATAIEQMIYLEEMAARGLPRSTNPQGLDVCAPTLADHGVGVEQEGWLHATLRGEMTWCVAIGDGEADAPGEGDGVRLCANDRALVLQGRLAAPPGAADADRCLCVAGPGPGVAEAAVVAVDLAAPGVTRPVPIDTSDRSGDGSGTLAFVDVAVADHDVVGGRDQGWAVLQSVRARLRSTAWISRLLATRRAVESLAAAGRARGLGDDGVFRDVLAGLHVDAESVRALAYRALAKQVGGGPNPELAMLPLVTAEVEQRVYLAGLEALGADGLDRGVDGPQGWPSRSWAEEWAAATVAHATAGGLGGERDRIAGRVLGLPLRAGAGDDPLSRAGR